MYTYLAVNLVKKKFQVGSTTDFERRQRQHLRDDNTIPFLNDLRNNPEHFFWFVSTDDGLEDRSEEQFYLDFYTGTPWCYNLNPNSEAPPNLSGHKFKDETLKKRSRSRKGNNYGVVGPNHPFFGKNHTEESVEANREAHLNRFWVNNGIEERSLPEGSEIPEGYAQGRLFILGKLKWWSNGKTVTRAMECPGEGWTNTRKVNQ